MGFKSVLSKAASDLGNAVSYHSSTLRDRESLKLILKKAAVRGGMVATALVLSDFALGNEAVGYQFLNLDIDKRFLHGYDEMKIEVSNGLENRAYSVRVMQGESEVKSLFSKFGTDGEGSGHTILKVDPNKLFDGCYQLVVRSVLRHHYSSTQFCYDSKVIDA